MGKWLKTLQIADSEQYEFKSDNPDYDVNEYITEYIKENEGTYFVNYSIVDDYKELKVCWEESCFVSNYAYLGDFFWRDQEGHEWWNKDWVDLMVEKIKEKGLDYTQYINEFKEALIQRYNEDIQDVEEFLKEGMEQMLKEYLNYIDKKYLNKSKSIENKELNKVNTNDDELSM